MQTQRQSHPLQQRLHAGEIAIVLFNLLVFGVGGYVALSFLILTGYQNWQGFLLGISACPPIAVLSTGFSAVTILLHQRRMASGAQFIAALSMLPSLLVMVWTLLIDTGRSRMDIPILFMIIAPSILTILLFVWFGWLLRRADASE